MVAGASTQGSGWAPSGKAFFPYSTELASAARRAPRRRWSPSSAAPGGGGGALVPMLVGLGVVVEQVVEGAADEDEVGYARTVEVEHDRPVDEHGHLRPVCAGELYEAREAPARRKTKHLVWGTPCGGNKGARPFCSRQSWHAGAQPTPSSHPAEWLQLGPACTFNQLAGVCAHASRSSRSARYESAQSITSSATPHASPVRRKARGSTSMPGPRVPLRMLHAQPNATRLRLRELLLLSSACCFVSRLGRSSSTSLVSSSLSSKCSSNIWLRTTRSLKHRAPRVPKTSTSELVGGIYPLRPRGRRDRHSWWGSRGLVPPSRNEK